MRCGTRDGHPRCIACGQYISASEEELAGYIYCPDCGLWVDPDHVGVLTPGGVEWHGSGDPPYYCPLCGGDMDQGR